MYLTDIKQIDNDYAIVHAKLAFLANWDIRDAEAYEENLYQDRIEILAEQGQKEAILRWYHAQDRKKLRGEPFKVNKRIDEQFEKMDKSSIQYKIIAIDKLRLEGETFDSIQILDSYQNKYDEIKDKIDWLEAEGLDKRKELNEEIAQLKMQQDKIRQQANSEWAHILETPYYVAIRNLIINEFNDLMNKVSVLDSSFLYRNVKFYVMEYNRALSKIGKQELYIANDNKKVIEKKLKALYKANPNVPYIALRYANILRNEKSLLLKLSGQILMNKVSKMQMSNYTKDLIADKILDNSELSIEE